MRFVSLTCLIAVTFILAACGRDSAQPQAQGRSAPWMLETPPADARSVSELKAGAREGDHIVVRARIGGRPQPLSDNTPVFTIMDLAIPHCGENPEDGCPTPWDYCCETPETIKAHAATVQIVDARGQSVTTNLRDAGLEALDEVVLVGTVGPRPTPEVLTIRASGVYVATQTR